jgi:hypothetical protein
MKDEITYKLADFLNQVRVFTHDSQVVYILVELRKLLDHYNAKASLVRFYADWAVHTKKDRITAEFKQVARSIYLDAKATIEATDPELAEKHSPLIAFAHGDTLASELQAFLIKHGIPRNLTQDAESWDSFVSFLVRVLENQPIIKPCDQIAKMYFVPAAKNCVILRVDFVQPIEGQMSFQYMNVLTRVR